MIDAKQLISKRIDDIQEQIDSCVSSILVISPLAYRGEQGMKELLAELGQNLIILQAKRQTLKEILEELT